MTNDDLTLIDALVLVSAISRAGARELVADPQATGRVATRIMELGLCNACGGGYVIVDRLAKYEAELADQARLRENACESPIGARLRLNWQCSCGGRRDLPCIVHGDPPETD